MNVHYCLMHAMMMPPGPVIQLIGYNVNIKFEAELSMVGSGRPTGEVTIFRLAGRSVQKY